MPLRRGWGEGINYRDADNNGDEVDQSPFLAEYLLKVAEPPSGRARGCLLACRRPCSLVLSPLGEAVSARRFGSALLSAAMTAKPHLASATGCAHFPADLSIDVSLESRVPLPRMNEFISAETNKL